MYFDVKVLLRVYCFYHNKKNMEGGMLLDSNT